MLLVSAVENKKTVFSHNQFVAAFHYTILIFIYTKSPVNIKYNLYYTATATQRTVWNDQNGIFHVQSPRRSANHSLTHEFLVSALPAAALALVVTVLL